MGPTLCILFCLGQEAPPPVVVTGCPRVVARDADWQKRLAKDVEAGVAPEILAALQEWSSLRNQSRTCRSAPPSQSR